MGASRKLLAPHRPNPAGIRLNACQTRVVHRFDGVARDHVARAADGVNAPGGKDQRVLDRGYDFFNMMSNEDRCWTFGIPEPRVEPAEESLAHTWVHASARLVEHEQQRLRHAGAGD